eukprot:gene5169-6434_t
MSTSEATGPLTEEEENDIWARSIETWKHEKAERKRIREEKIAAGIPVKSEEEENNEWKNLPIFMEELPQDPNSNESLKALQAITDESTPEERSESFKNLGNDYFKGGKEFYSQALYYYNQALNVKCDNLKLNSVYLSNRAAVNLELKNYGHVIKDCTIAIEFNPENVKAYFRGAKASFALGKYKESIEFCDGGLKVDSANKELKTIKENSQQKLDAIAKREREKREAEERKKMELIEKSRQLKLHGMVLGEPKFEMTQYTGGGEESTKIHFESVDNNGIVIHFPVVFLYPEFGQSDYIKDFQDQDTFGDHLQVMFPPGTDYAPWDKEKAYTLDRIEVYFETNWTKPVDPSIKLKSEKRWIRVKHTTEIIKVLQHKEYIIPSIPIFYIISRGTKYYKSFLNPDIPK